MTAVITELAPEITQWNEMTAREAVSRLLEYVRSNPLAIGELHSREEILEWIGVTGPDRSRGPASIHEEYKRWRDLQVLQKFIHEFQVETGLYLETVPGAGFRVLHPSANVPTANEMAHKRVSTVLQKSMSIIRHTRPEQLDTSQMQERTASLNTLGGFQVVFDEQMARRKRKQQAAPGPNVGIPPVLSPQSSEEDEDW